ncbi:MAG: hypothetical protein F4Z01_01310 [Gammaproteobacteria bacterium]|nr:hypothetical protein [Gammaproteobacteria bacterium]MYF37268.1 hypothetical protein [Gammaproteobacteria bacterium]
MRSLSFRAFSLLLGVLLGIATVSVLLILLPTKGANTGSPVSTSTTDRSLPTDHATQTVNTGSNSQSEYVANVNARIDELELPSETFSRKLRVATWIGTLTDEQILENLDLTTKSTWNVSLQVRRDTQTSLIKKLSLNAPSEALVFAIARIEPQRTALISTVFQQWALMDIDEAVARAKEFPEQERTRLIHSILHALQDQPREKHREIASELGNEEYARTFYLQSLTKVTIENPKDTWYEIVDLVEAENSQQLAALRKVATAWVAQEGLGALDEIRATIKDDFNRDTVSFGIFLEHVKTHPEATFDYANALTDIPAMFLNSVVASWAQQDYEAVLAKAETLSPSGVKDRMLSRAYRAWGEDKPIAFLKQLNEIPAGHQETARVGAIPSLPETDLPKAAELILQLDKEELQATMAEALVQKWSRYDVEAAMNWVSSLSNRESLATNLHRTIAYSVVSTQPRLAFQIAQDLPETPREGMSLGNEAQILHLIAGDDMQVAMELLPSVREDNRIQAYQVVANQMINLGDTQDVFTLGRQLPDEERVEYFESVAIHWTRKDPKELLREFEKFPTAKVKSKSALALITKNRLITAYSADEISSLEEYLQPEDEAVLNQTGSPEGTP